MAIAIIVSIGALLTIVNVSNNNKAEQITTTVEEGLVRQLVSVSGIAKAKQIADLAFPTTGIVNNVFVELGDEVVVGDILITLDTRALYADKKEALASLAQAIANHDELLAGPTDYARKVTSNEVISKQENLKTTYNTETQKTQNAYRVLLSSGLTAYTNQDDEEAAPPVISGTYSCSKEGKYELTLFSSGADSGYSYKLEGIETGTYTASVDQAVPFGNCGLRIQFDPFSKYSRSLWVVEIPNTKSSSYTTNLNTYTLTKTQAESNIRIAEQTLTLAKANADNQNAPARVEAITRVKAEITQAEARLNRINSTIIDRTLTAPFNGVVTLIEIEPGETVTTLPVVTLLASTAFDVTVRIPEIDIGKVLINQTVEMIFDAKITETIIGDITFISPQATEIDGVSYYEAVIQFKNSPVWMRSGLNADVKIITSEQKDVMRVPKRFINEYADGYIVLKKQGETFSSTTVTVTLEGNDGFIAITGLNLGDTVIAP